MTTGTRRRATGLAAISAQPRHIATWAVQTGWRVKRYGPDVTSRASGRGATQAPKAPTEVRRAPGEDKDAADEEREPGDGRRHAEGATPRGARERGDDEQPDLESIWRPIHPSPRGPIGRRPASRARCRSTADPAPAIATPPRPRSLRR